jgi:hypothetical protein
MNNKMIVNGYKGIIDLDLSLIDPKFHKDAIERHYKDIEEYKLEQQSRPEKLRYESAIIHALNILELDRKALKKTRIESSSLQQKKDQKREEIFGRIQKMKREYNL